jgi:hypothetical protein
MAVTFTPNVGLAKVTESELAEDWINGPQLESDNNLIIIDKTDVNLTSYNPVLVGQTTAPQVGAGSKRGEYQDAQGFVTASFSIEFLNAGIVVGSGEYGISLPFPVDGTYHNVGSALNSATGTFSVIGEGYVFDSSSVAGGGSVALDVVTIAGVSYVRMITEAFTSPAKTSRVFRDAMPFTLADSDKWSGLVFYKRT